jgi:hypothetical protein
MKDESGFALIMLLIFISIFSEILLSMMSSEIFAGRTLVNFMTHVKSVYKADIIFAQIKDNMFAGETAYLNKATCPIQTDVLADHETCTYKINFLQTVPCFTIKNSNQTGVDFFNVTVMLAKHDSQTMTIERTLVKPARVSHRCQTVPVVIDAGWASWRLVE